MMDLFKILKNIYKYDENGNPLLDTIITPILDGWTPIGWDTTVTQVIDYIDTIVTRNRIKNFEYGVYSGIDKKLLNETLLINTTVRLDKNQNFNFLFSPAASIVWKASEKDLLRLSFFFCIAKSNINRSISRL